ncbi:MAG: glycosyltransferase family 2 protein [bacterium]|nr:glycosyltransferase family 2 protein [bacterium]
MISVIIVNYNGKKFIRKLAESLKSQTFPYGEVVIVDNNSTDRSGEELFRMLDRALLIKLDENIGFAGAVNLGVKESSGENIILLNNDLYLDAYFIENALKNLERDRRAFFAPLVMDYFNDKIDSAGDGISAGFRPVKRLSGRLPENLKRTEVEGFSMSASYFRKMDFIDVGCLDEKFFMYFEDVDFSIRAREKEYRIFFTPECTAYHFISASTKSGYRGLYSPQKTFWEARNRVWVFFKSSLKKNPLKVLEFAFGTLSSMKFHAHRTGYLTEYIEGLLSSLLRNKK